MSQKEVKGRPGFWRRKKKSLSSALFVLILTNISGFNLNGSLMSYIKDKGTQGSLVQIQRD